MITRRQRALWANRLQRECLLEAGDDVEAGLAAADILLATQEYKDYGEDTGWIDVPDSFLGIALAVEEPQPIIVNVAPTVVNLPEMKPNINVAAATQKAPIVKVPKQERPVVNFAPVIKGPVVKVPKQEKPVVNVAGPVINVPEPKEPKPAPSRKLTVKKNAAGEWEGTSVEE